MKVLVLLLFLSIINDIKGWEVSQVEGILGEPLLVLLDSQSNSIVIAQDSDSFTLRRLYKLDSQKNILLQVDLTDTLVNYFINGNDDFYLTTWTADGSTIISAVKADSLTLDIITEVGSGVLVYMDNDSNLIYNAEGSGVYFLKYNTSKAVRVQNLEDFSISAPVTTDKKGNTYLAGSRVKDHQLVLITAESKEDIPEGVVIDGVHDDPENEFIYNLAITGNNEVLISTSNGGTEATLKKYSDNSLTTILSGEQYQYYKLRGNDKIIIITSCDYNVLRCRLSYLTLDGEIVGISNLLNKTTAADNFKNVINNKGDVFISNLNKVDLSPLEILNYADTKTVPIYFNESVEVKIYDIDLDKNENLWILTSNRGVFYLENELFNPEQVPNTEGLTASQFVVSKRTDEILLQSKTGLYIVTK